MACRDATGPAVTPVAPDALLKLVPAATSWTAIAPLATARHSFGAAAAAGRIYIIGGTSAANVTLASVEVYNPITNAWSAGPSLPVGRTGLAAVTGADGRIYVLGGRVAPYGAPAGDALVLDPVLGTWTSVAGLPSPRDYLAAALGSDGRIYAIGGAMGPVLGTVEAYDPVHNSWSTAAPMPTPRAVLAATGAADGRIYAIGGTDGSRDLATVEAYTPGSNSWSPSTPLSLARQGLGAATLSGRVYVADGDAGALAEVYSVASNAWAGLPAPLTARRQGAAVAGPDGRLYVFGGVGASGTVLASAEVFRPATLVQVNIDIQPGDPLNRINLGDSGFVRVALLRSPGFNPNSVDGSTLRFEGAAPIVLHGGQGWSARDYDEHGLNGWRHDRGGDWRPDRVFRFAISALNIAPGETRACLSGLIDKGSGGEFEGCGAIATGGMPRMWSLIAPMNDVRFLGVAVADATGRVFALGGWDGVQSEEDMVERYDATLDQWTHVAPMGQQRSGLGGALGADGRIYVAGGFDGTNALSSAQAYNPDSDSWTTLPAMPNLHDETALGTSTDGRVFVFGGHNEVVVNGTVDVFNPTTGTWSAGAAMPAARYDHAVVRAPNGEIYVLGGLDSFTATAPVTTAWAYNPATNTWRTLASLPAARSSAAAAVDAKGIVYLIGGDDGTGPVNTVFAYDPTTNTWSQVAGMSSPREGHGAATLADGRILATGGYDGALFVRTVEAFAKP